MQKEKREQLKQYIFLLIPSGQWQTPPLHPEMLWHQLTLLSGCSVKSPWLEYLPFNL